MASDDTYATNKRASDPKERAGNHFLPAGFCCCLITFFTILASSTRKARMILNFEAVSAKKKKTTLKVWPHTLTSHSHRSVSHHTHDGQS